MNFLFRFGTGSTFYLRISVGGIIMTVVMIYFVKERCRSLLKVVKMKFLVLIFHVFPSTGILMASKIQWKNRRTKSEKNFKIEINV